MKFEEIFCEIDKMGDNSNLKSLTLKSKNLEISLTLKSQNCQNLTKIKRRYVSKIAFNIITVLFKKLKKKTNLNNYFID